MLKTIEEINVKRYMGYLLLLCIAILATGCQYLPQIAEDVESVATDTAIKIEISKVVFDDQTNLDISVKRESK